MAKPAYLYRLIRDTVIKWNYDEAPMMGAALAYYSLFSIAPLLVVALAIASAFFGPEAARGELEHQLMGYFGADVAKSIQTLLQAAQKSDRGGFWAVIIGAGALLFGATSVFHQLKIALNRIWKVETPRHSGFKGLVINRLLALAMVLIVGGLLLSSVFLSAALSRLSAYATNVLPISPSALQYADLGLTFLLLTILFALIYRFLPDVRIGWGHVLFGASFTSVLYAIGKFMIGLYIAHAAVASGYGAASSVLVLLIWIYYSAMIFLFGAEFTHVYSRAHHLPAEPVIIEEEDAGDNSIEEPGA